MKELYTKEKISGVQKKYVKSPKREVQQHVQNWVKENLGETFKFRPFQFDTIVSIVYDQVNSKTYTHHIVQAPTGSGKSLINIISAGVLYKYYNIKSYILCSDLYLYSQYEEFIDTHNLKDFGYMKGQTGNYICPKSGCDARCGECKIKGFSYNLLFCNTIEQLEGYFGNRKKKIDINKDTCPIAFNNQCTYIEERKQALNAGVTLMTYQCYHFQMNICDNKWDTHGKPITGAFRYRDTIFCDECHNIPQIVQERCRPTIQKEDYDKMLKIYSYYVKVKTDPEFKKYVRQKQTKVLQYMQEKYPETKDLRNAFNEHYKLMLNPKLESYDTTIALLNYEAKFVRPITWICDHLSNYMKAKLNKGFTLNDKDKEVNELIAWLQNYHCYLDDFARAIEATGYIYTIKQISPDKKTITFSCVKEDGMIAAFLLSHRIDFPPVLGFDPDAPYYANGVALHNTVCTSATCGDIDTFIENMGYSHVFANPKFINVDTSFDFSTSPIYIYDKIKMSYREKEKNMPLMCAMIHNILKKHKTENGIIQTGSYANAKTLYEMLPKEQRKRIMLYDNSATKQECIDKIKKHTNYVLIGPSLNEGIDLPGELCNFIIIMKIPFLSLADKYVARKMQLFKTWYANVATTNLIQGIGRGNRFDKDKCSTYILDGCFKKLYSKTQSQFPKYLIDRFVKVNQPNEMFECLKDAA